MLAAPSPGCAHTGKASTLQQPHTFSSPQLEKLLQMWPELWERFLWLLRIQLLGWEGGKGSEDGLDGAAAAHCSFQAGRGRKELLSGCGSLSMAGCWHSPCANADGPCSETCCLPFGTAPSLLPGEHIWCEVFIACSKSPLDFSQAAAQQCLRYLLSTLWHLGLGTLGCCSW